MFSVANTRISGKFAVSAIECLAGAGFGQFNGTAVTMSDINTMDSGQTLSRTAMVAGEVLLPGASDLIAGNVASGVGHFVLTGLAVALLAPTMPVLATIAAIGLRVNSYSHATTGTSAIDGLRSRIQVSTAPQQDVAPPAPAKARS